MSALSKVRVVNVRKDDTKKMEDEARRMEVKLELLRRTVDTAEPAKAGGGEGGRWRSGSSSKPLTKGYVRGVLEAPSKPSAKTRSGSQPRAPSAGTNTTGTEERDRRDAGGSDRAITMREPNQEARSPVSAAMTGGASRAAANLQAAMQQQSKEGLEVEAFLAGLKLDRYVSLFMEHGFDCMEVVQDMQEHHMKEIGMAAGHILKLRKKLTEMAPPPAAAAEPGATTSGSTQRRVSFGATEEAKVAHGPSAAGTGTGTGGSFLQGGFSEEESAASFQEALRAWREGRDASGTPRGPAKTGTNGSGSPGGAPKGAPGSFWSSIGDCEMDLSRVSTPLRATAEAQPEPQRENSSNDEKLCCYQCYKQFFAKYAVERSNPSPTVGGSGVKRLCSEACAENWVAAMQAKAEAVRKRQEKLEKMQVLMHDIPSSPVQEAAVAGVAA
mmetsp:Transcript_9034/g.28177  ORF Transcript_9034/g.28177 Transcript_9034/m.28177 type:complete len:441 (-) Transcript_9034:115-1437(-)